MGMCIQPTGPNPRLGISTIKPTSKSLGPALSCKKHAQNSTVKESMATQNKPQKLGKPNCVQPANPSPKTATNGFQVNPEPWDHNPRRVQHLQSNGLRDRHSTMIIATPSHIRLPKLPRQRSFSGIEWSSERLLLS